MKKLPLFAVYAVLLAQCDIWNKPLIESILKDAEKNDQIEKVMVTKYPYPNTFNISDEPPAVLKNGDAEGWTEYGLEVSGITSAGEIRKLSPAEYTVEKIEAFPSAEAEIPVTVTLNGDPGITTLFNIAAVSFSENNYEVNINPGISNGSLVPYPSLAEEGKEIKVYIQPVSGYSYIEDSISNIPPPPHIIDFSRNEDGTITFTMPGGSVTLTAEFFKADAKLEKEGQPAMYYETLGAAFDKVGSGNATITLLNDVEIEKEITVTGGVTLIAADGKEKTIRRAGVEGSLFTVNENAGLNLNAGNSLGLTLDGALDSGKTAAAALVTVSGGTLTVNDRVALQNNNNGGNGGGVRIYSGSFNMTGGAISGNTAGGSGGGVFIDSGAFTMEGGAISDNESAGGSGGGVYVNSGALEINDDAVIRDNVAADLGGGVLIRNSGSFNMSGGAISGNAASNGGGVYIVDSAGKFTMNGSAVMSGNTANNNGGGVYVANGEFKMSDSAVVKQDNDVYLPKDSVITVAATLTPEQNKTADESAFSARITPEDPGDDLVIITGASGILQNAVGKFTLNTGAPTALSVVDTNAVLRAARSSMKFGNETVYFASLKEAVDSIGTGGSSANPAVISLMDDADIDVTVTVASNKHIKIKPDGKNVTVKRGAATGSLFTISSNASLALEGSGNASLVIDGGWDNVDGKGLEATSALVYVKTSGTFTLNDGAALKNNKNTTNHTGGGVHLAWGSTFTMTGGAISGNTATHIGGGVYVDGTSALFEMTGGTIRNNTATSAGGGISIGAYGTFTMTGGIISGNKASYYGGGVYRQSSGTFKMRTGTIYGSDETGNSSDDGLPLKNTAPNGGAAYYDGGVSGTANYIDAAGAKVETITSPIAINIIVIDGVHQP